VNSDYGLDEEVIWVRSPAGSKVFFLYPLCPDRLRAHPASCTMGNAGPVTGGKALPGRDADHSPPSSAEVMNDLELYILSPKRLHGV
jgi:hypothetical protein